MWWRREVQTYSDSAPDLVPVTLAEILESTRRIEAGMQVISNRITALEIRMDRLEAERAPRPRTLAEYGPGPDGAYV